MGRKPLSKLDPIEHEIERALNPGTFIKYRECYSFVCDLQAVAAKIGNLIASDPARAIVLHQTFLAGCSAKAEELDDSSGSFGQFVGDLICSWIKARQAAGSDPDQTVATLLTWMDDDPYAFCYELEKDTVKAFDKAGRSAFEKQITMRFEAAGAAKPVPGKPPGAQPEYLRRHWSEVLRTIYLAQRNIAAYVALAAHTGLTGQDCLALATLQVTRRKPIEALAWVERGMELCRHARHESAASFDLAKLQRDLLTKLGRDDEALDLAWAEFQKHPGTYTYEDLMKLVPKSGRAIWHEKALDTAKGADLHSHIELLIETKETQRLADLIGSASDAALEHVTHHATEPAAKKLEKAHPELAARLWRAQGFRIVDAKKSRYYPAALSNFAHAKRCYERAGLATGWEATIRRVRSRHSRKTGFLSGFEAIAASSRPDKQPSFLERAKTRWDGRYGGAHHD